jgi:hypothetical protein
MCYTFFRIEEVDINLLSFGIPLVLISSRVFVVSIRTYFPLRAFFVFSLLFQTG